MANLTTTTSANFLPEIWSKEIIRATEDNLVLADLVWRFDADVAQAGDTIHIPALSNLVANTKTAGLPVSFQAPTEGVTNLSVNTHREASFLLEDITKIQSSYDLMSEYTSKAGHAIAEAIDSSLAALATGFSQNNGTYNTAITTDVVLDSIQNLDEANAPQDNRAFVFRPDVKRDLLDLSTYTSSDFIGGKPVESGQLGTLYGVDVFMSMNIAKSGNNTSNMMFHKEALALALQSAPRVQSDYSIDDLAHKVVVDALYGVVETRDLFGVEVRT
jgi:N4-gp56 family major capsid protein|tara:strand:+ start:7724 stop:8545 length:822 start_codon:yes stop_codon:yes gene_type:complete